MQLTNNNNFFYSSMLLSKNVSNTQLGQAPKSIGPKKIKFKQICYIASIIQIFLFIMLFMWSPLMRRHLSDHLLWSVFQSSIADLSHKGIAGNHKHMNILNIIFWKQYDYNCPMWDSNLVKVFFLGFKEDLIYLFRINFFV